MTGTFLKNGKSDYKILIPDNADFYEEYAAKEFKRLFFDATGVTLSIVKDSDEKITNWEENQAYFSLGNTQIFKTSGVSNDFNLLKRDGYRIVTKGKTLILIGGGGYGTVYAVYGFMERQFGYRYYHPEEVYIKKTADEELKEFDITDIPDFENRTGGNYYSGSDASVKYKGIADCAIRMRTFEFWGKMRDGKPFWGSWVHNHGAYLDGRKYEKAHPDWYSPELTQLCLSNEEMWKEFAKNVIRRVEKFTEQEYFGLGQEDAPTFCGCDRCKEQIKKYGKSGIMMRFTNYVAREVEKWRKENAPERKVYVGTLAYHLTGEPPVKKDENGKYVPLDPSVVAEDTLLFFLKDNIMLFAQLMISYFFYKKIKGTRAFQIIFYLPSIVSGVAISTVFTSFINPEGPLGEICKSLGYKLPPLLASSTYKTWTIMFYTIWLGWAGNMLLLNGALARIPVEVIESARLDGVTAFREFVSIIFPLVWSTFSTLLILGFTGLLSAGGPILLFMDYGGVLDTWTVGFWMFYRIKIIGESAYNEVSAMGLYLTAIALPIIFFARKLVEKVPAVEY